MKFWDSSAVVPLLVRQPATAFVESLLNGGDGLFVWWATPVECISATMRLRRERTIEPEQAERAIQRLRALALAWHEVEPQARVRDLAEQVLRRHALRAADALQLAAAGVACRERTTGSSFVSLDRRLLEAAGAEGFTAITA